MTDFQRLMAIGVLLYGSLTVAGLFFANMWAGNAYGMALAVACSFASYVSQSFHVIGASARMINGGILAAVILGAASGVGFFM